MQDKQSQPESNPAVVRHYLEVARAGQVESAFFGLIDLDKSVLPILEQEFRAERDPPVRAFIIKVVWNARWPGSIPLMAEALSDPQPQVWNQALDGLVALASPESSAVVASAIALATDSKRCALLQEALQQIKTSIAGL